MKDIAQQHLVSRKVNVDGRRLRPNWYLFVDVLNAVFNDEAGTKAKQFAWIDWVKPEISTIPCILVDLDEGNRPIPQNSRNRKKSRRKIAIQMFNSASYMTSPFDRPGSKTLIKPSADQTITVLKMLGYEVLAVDVPPSLDKGHRFQENLKRRAQKIADILSRRIPIPNLDKP